MHKLFPYLGAEKTNVIKELKKKKPHHKHTLMENKKHSKEKHKDSENLLSCK